MARDLGKTARRGRPRGRAVADPVATGERIRRLREGFSMRQQDLAAAVGIARASLAMIETGGSSPGEATLKRLAEAFSVPPEYLRSGEGAPDWAPLLNAKFHAAAENLEEVELLVTWRRFDPVARRKILDLLQREAPPPTNG